MKKTVNIAIRNKSSRYVALDLCRQDKVIAEGKTATAVADRARRTGRPFSIMFVPERDKTYVF